MIRVVRLLVDGAPRAARLVDEQRAELYDHDDPLAALHTSAGGEIVELTGHEMLPPVHAPEIWCAGVTYERSRDARLEEAQTEARAMCTRSSTTPTGPSSSSRTPACAGRSGRADTSVPGATRAGRSPSRSSASCSARAVEPVAVTIGNDVSSRDIEGANPLYIPQAKVYAGACAIGPALAVPDDWDAAWTIRLQIADGDGRELFAGETSTSKMKRHPSSSPSGSSATTRSGPDRSC